MPTIQLQIQQAPGVNLPIERFVSQTKNLSMVALYVGVKNY